MRNRLTTAIEAAGSDYEWEWSTANLTIMAYEYTHAVILPKPVSKKETLGASGYWSDFLEPGKPQFVEDNDEQMPIVYGMEDAVRDLATRLFREKGVKGTIAYANRVEELLNQLVMKETNDS